MTTRRSFLKTSGQLSGVLWLSSTAIAALAPGTSWALDLTQLDAAAGRALLQLIRFIYPHRDLDDAVYALAVKDLDRGATADASLAALLTEGLAALDDAAQGDWLGATTDHQLAVVKSIAGSAFFTTIRSRAVVSLYNNELAFAHFAYAGSAFEKGGYLERGFNDLDWLPQPPPNASPR
ncbi:MAG: tat (twin-arginine translocation) pathway signal sequence [Gammaproteobacteria bacterium]|jgi:hypothetical protein